jgi:outer membrane protein assembly factor BamB/tetratricopeptide (TPR) repeat protein
MNRIARRPAALLIVGLAFSVLLGWEIAAVAKPAAQGGAGAEETDESPFTDNVFPTADRRLLQLRTKALRLVEEERYTEAVQCLGTILYASEDAFFRPDANSGHYSGIKAEAQAILGRLPRQGREIYELQCGAQARSMLSAAASAGDAAGLAEVSRRFFHTRAGYEATFLLGLHQWKRGSPLAAAMTLKRLKESCPVADEFEPGLSAALAASWFRAGVPSKAQPVLDDLRQRFSKSAVRIGGREVSLADGGAALIRSGVAVVAGLQAAEGWLMFGGNPARNASVEASGPLLSAAWRIPTSEHPYVESLIEQIQQSNRDQDRWALPALHPLVVQNVVLMRTARNLLAVDYLTGKRVWEVPGDDPFESLSEATIGYASQSAEAFGGMRSGGFDLQAALRYRLWGDATFGSLSSDGQRVFAIEDLSLDLGTASGRAMFMPNRRILPTDPKAFNRLAAYDIQTGKLIWHAGGSPEELGLAQAGTFFLGSPLPVAGQLYAIGEQKGDIRLMVLDAKTGNTAWTQQLAVVDQERDIVQDPLRRVSGVSPSYADGILVCPTSNKSVVAVEPATRSLLWGYVYKPADAAQSRQPPMFFGVSPPSDPEPANRWAQSQAILADGRVLVTPVDSAELHCLNVIDGKLLWRKPRQDNLRLACVCRGKVILLGRQGLSALKLSNGEPAWSPPRTELPPGAMPSGVGFLGGDRYYLPLASGEVAAVELDSGRISHLFQSRRGVVPGNLVCWGGRVLSQRGGAVEQFFQLDALRKQVDERLAAKPDDPETLAQRGEILWDAGKLQDAVECFRRAVKLTDSPNARNLLRDALLEGLRTDFERYRHAGDEIRGLVEEPRHEAVYLRLMAAGFERAKQFGPALEHYLKLVDVDQKHRELDAVDKSHSVRRDRWIQVQLAELRSAAPADFRAEIDRAIKTRLDGAVKAGTVEALRQFLDYFGTQPLADEARAHLVARLREGRRLLQAELLLRRTERSENRATAGAAAAEMAFMLREAKLADDAAACFRRLRDRFGDVVCRDGRTGRQLADALAKDDPVRRGLEPETPWPTGAIVVERKRQTNTPPMAFYSATVPYHQGRGPFFSDLNVELHQNPPELVARDGWGRLRWRMPTSELMRHESFPMSSAFLRVTVCDHLLLLSIGFKIVAIDTLAAAERGSPKVLWIQDLEEPVKTTARRGSRRATLPGVPAMRGFGAHGNVQFPVNVPAAVSEQLVCYQRYQNLYGVDPVSGEVVWVREDIRPDSTVWGDHEYVLVLPPNQNAATVLRAADGKKVGDPRRVPSVRPATLGRLVASWRVESTEAVLEMTDPLTDARVWPPRKFAPDAKIFSFENGGDMEVIGVYEPKGHFTLVNLADGRDLVDAPVERGGAALDVHLFRSPEQTLVVLSGLERTSSSGRHYYGLQGVPGVQISRAKIYAFDAGGKPLWRQPVSVQDQYLVLRQPQRFPAVIFACGVQDRRAVGTSQPQTAILAVDKRTGQVVQPKERYEGLSHFRLIGDPEKKTIEVHLQRQVVALQFTDQPVTAPPKDKDEKKAASTSSALIKALRRGVERALNVPIDEEEDSDDKR